jgi:hypothetical protein
MDAPKPYEFIGFVGPGSRVRLLLRPRRTQMLSPSAPGRSILRPPTKGLTSEGRRDAKIQRMRQGL